MIKAFIVDDEIFIIKGLMKKIKWEDFFIHVVGTATDGIEAYNMILEHKPDIVITDIRMPGMDGLELIESLKKKLPDIYFIIISGYDDFCYLQKALRIGAFDYILKPIDGGDLETILVRAIKQIRDSSEDGAEINEIEQVINDKIYNNTVDNIIRYIENNYFLDINLNMVADTFNLNPSYLSTVFKKVTGQNFSDYITAIKIEKAKQLLSYTDYKITEIGSRVGFSNYRQFIRNFKKVVGITPSDFKEEEGRKVL